MFLERAALNKKSVPGLKQRLIVPRSNIHLTVVVKMKVKKYFGGWLVRALVLLLLLAVSFSAYALQSHDGSGRICAPFRGGIVDPLHDGLAT